MSTREACGDNPSAVRAKKTVNLGRTGILLISAGVILIVCDLLFHEGIIELLATYVSQDQQITLDGDRQLTNSFYFLMAVMMVVGCGMVWMRDQAVCSGVAEVFLGEPAPVRPSPRFVLLASTLAGLFLIVHINLYGWGSRAFRLLYHEDGVFEQLTPVLLVIAAFVMGKALWQLKKLKKPGLGVYLAAACIVILMLGFFLDAGEEISWGQRIIGWQTPAAFSGNVQQETNAHNYYNNDFPLLYRSLIVIPFFVLVSAWLQIKKRWLPFARLVLPHPSTIGLACLIAFVSLIWWQQQELLEEMLATLALFWSLGTYRQAVWMRLKVAALSTQEP